MPKIRPRLCCSLFYLLPTTVTYYLQYITQGRFTAKSPRMIVTSYNVGTKFVELRKPVGSFVYWSMFLHFQITLEAKKSKLSKLSLAIKLRSSMALRSLSFGVRLRTLSNIGQSLDG
jgi:hypothetical protein